MLVMLLSDDDTYTGVDGCHIIDADPNLVNDDKFQAKHVRAVVAAFRLRHDGIIEMHIPNDWKGELAIFTDKPECTLSLNGSEV